MKKILAVMAVIIILCAAGAAFAADPIKVGYLSPLTGVSAAFGVAEVNMVKIAVDEINSKGGVLGRPIELVIYDTKCRNEDAMNAVRRMVDSDKVVAILGSIQSGIEIATATISNNARVPRISTGATNPIVTVDSKGKVRPYSFRICFTDPYQGALAAELAMTTLKKDKAAILYNVGSDYAHGLREYFKKDFTALGGKIVCDEGFMDADVDYRAQLTKIKHSGANVLWLPGNGKDMALTIKQAKELGLDITVIGSDSYGEFMNEIAGDAMKGTYWINHTYIEDPATASIFKRYKEVYGDDCKEFVYATLGYDAVYWLADAIKRAGKVDREAIRNAIENTKNLQLKHCVLTLDPATHNPLKKSGVILKVGDDLKAKFYKKIAPK